MSEEADDDGSGSACEVGVPEAALKLGDSIFFLRQGAWWRKEGRGVPHIWGAFITWYLPSVAPSTQPALGQSVVARDRRPKETLDPGLSQQALLTKHGLIVDSAALLSKFLGKLICYILH